MASRNFKLSIDVESRKAERDLKKFNKTLDDTNKKQKENARASKGSEGGMKGFTSSLGPATRALAGTVATITAGIAAYQAFDQAIRQTVSRIRDLENFANVADTTIQSFQAMNVVAQRFNVTGEKLADQVKDFRDKLGDFTANGAGPLVQIFEQLEGQTELTAEQLTRMSGPESLGAMLDALEQSNLSTAELTTAQEALASDLRLTSDAFRNQAQAIKDTEARLGELGATLNIFEVEEFKKFGEATALLDAQWETFWTRIQLQGLPLMTEFANSISWILQLFNRGSERDQEFFGLKTKAEQVNFLKNEISGLRKQLEEVDDSRISPFGQESGAGMLGGQFNQASRDRLALLEQIQEKTKQLGILENQITEENNKQQKERNDEKARENALIKATQDALQATQDRQKAMAEGLKEYNEELKRTSFINSELAKLNPNLKPEQVESLRKAYGELYDTQVRLLQVEKDRKATNALVLQEESANEQLRLAGLTSDEYEEGLRLQQITAQVQAYRNQLVAQEVGNVDQLVDRYRTMLMTQEEAVELAEERAKIETRDAAFSARRTAMGRELLLLNQINDENRERLQLEFELQDAQYTPQQAEALRALNEQIIARQQHLDMLEKEKEAVQDLAEAMGRWASGSEDAVKQVIAQLIRLIAIKAFGGTGTFLGGFLQGFGSGGINGYADGGSFRSGETFMVGERGPEIITASAPGMVIPNHQLGGGGVNIMISPQLSISGGVNSADDLSNILTDFSSEIAVQTQNMIKRQLTPRGVLA